MVLESIVVERNLKLLPRDATLDLPAANSFKELSVVSKKRIDCPFIRAIDLSNEKELRFGISDDSRPANKI